MLLRPDSVLYGLVVLAPGAKPDFSIAPMFCGRVQRMEQTHRCVSNCDVLGMHANGPSILHSANDSSITPQSPLNHACGRHQSSKWAPSDAYEQSACCGLRYVLQHTDCQQY